MSKTINPTQPSLCCTLFLPIHVLTTHLPLPPSLSPNPCSFLSFSLGNYKNDHEFRPPESKLYQRHDFQILESYLNGNILSREAKSLPKYVPPGRVLLMIISSTFTDTHPERNLILGEISKELQKYGQDKGIEIKFVDMRYGGESLCFLFTSLYCGSLLIININIIIMLTSVSASCSFYIYTPHLNHSTISSTISRTVRDDNTLDHMTWLACKAEIERCFRLSAGYAFISLQVGCLSPNYVNNNNNNDDDDDAEYTNLSVSSLWLFDLTLKFHPIFSYRRTSTAIVPYPNTSHCPSLTKEWNHRP